MSSAEAFQKSFKRRKIIVRTAVAAMAFLVTSLFVVPTVYAESSQMTKHKDYVEQITSYISFGVVQQIYSIFLRDQMSQDLGKSLGDKGDGVVQPEKVSLRMFLELRDVENTLNIYAYNISRYMSYMGAALVLVFSSIHMFKELSRGGGDGVGSIEMWARIFIPAVVSILVIAYSDPIITGIENIGKYIMSHTGKLGTRMVSITGTASTSFQEWLQSVFTLQGDWIEEEAGLNFVRGAEITVNNIGMEFWSLVHKLALNAILIVVIFNMMSVQVMLYSLWMELYIRKTFFPLAVADCLGEGPRSPGVLYMKRLLAVYVRIALCIMVAFIGDALLAAALNMKLDPTVEMAIPLAIIYVGNIILVFRLIIQMLLSTSQLANQIVGA